jgi:cellulose synthase operon protein C
MLARVDTMPYGQEERALIDEIIALADESGDDDRGFAARAKLVNSAQHLGDTESMLTAFAWCLSMNGRNPKRYPLISGPGGVNLLWAYKWTVESLAASPIFPRSQIEEAISDLTLKYREAGVGESGALSAAYHATVLLGDLKKSEKLHEAFVATPRDSYSDCEACTASSGISRLIRLGKDAEAVAEMERMIESDLSCTEEPARSVAKTLVPLLMTGEAQRALGLHFPAYRSIRDNPGNLSQLAGHVLFCAVSGNLDRGVELIERHVSWLVWDLLDARALLTALLSFAVLLDDVAASTASPTSIRIADSRELDALLGITVSAATVSELAAACWNTGSTIAGDFDRRNSNDTFSKEVARYRRLVGVRREALIAPDAAALPPIADPPARPTTAIGWFFYARELWSADDSRDALVAAEKGLQIAEGYDRARLLLTTARLYTELSDPEKARMAAEERWSILSGHGLAEIADAEAALGEVWLTAAKADDISPVIAAIDATGPHGHAAESHLAAFRAHHAREQGDFDATINFAKLGYEGDLAIPDEHAAARNAFSVAEALLMKSELDEAEAWLDKIDSLETDRIVRAQVRFERSRLALMRGDAARGLDEANEALAVLMSARLGAGVAQTAMLSADALDALGRHGEALSRTALAVRTAERSELRELSVIRRVYAQRLIHSGRANEALEILLFLYEKREELDLDAGAVADVLFHSAEALSALGQEDAAVGAWLDAVPLFVESNDQGQAANSELQAARGLLSLDRPTEAIAHLESAQGRLRSSDLEDSPAAAETALALGVALARAGRQDGLQGLERALANARAAENDWQVGRALRALAFAHAALGDKDSAIAAAMLGAEAFVLAEDVDGASATEGFAASTLAEDGRFDEAAVIFRTAIDRLQPGDNLHIGLSFDLASVLDQLGRSSEAEQVRAAADTLN